MANFKFFASLAILGSYLRILSAALLPIHYNDPNQTTIWPNSDTSHQTQFFQDGSKARFILLKQVESEDGCGFGFGFGFYCYVKPFVSCYLSVTFVEMFQGTIVERQHPLVVWSANRDSPVSENASFRFSSDGNLDLCNAEGQRIWFSGTSGKSVWGMSIDAQGNWVIFNTNNDVVWQSFEHPGDVLLPGQRMIRGQQLISSVSAFDISRGPFHLNVVYGLSASVEVDKPIQYLIFPPTVLAKFVFQLKYVELTKENISFLYEAEGASQVVNFQTPIIGAARFLRLDADGGLRVYGWECGIGWRPVYMLLEGWDECQLPMKCGKYGVCQRGQCTCPAAAADGMTYFTAVNMLSPNDGCRIQNFSSQRRCGDHLVKFEQLSYFSYFDQTAAIPGLIDEESCKKECESKGYCKMAFFLFDRSAAQGHCFLHSEVLSMNGNLLPAGYDTALYIKVPKLSCTHKYFFSHNTRLVVFAFVLIVLTVLAIASLLLLHNRQKYRRKEKDFLKGASEIPIRFSYGELCSATQKFSERLGVGGFGTVYKGVLKDGTAIAVKRLENTGQGIKEFLAEVDTIGSIHHINLVRLIGFCIERKHRMLVYEYMSNGSLDKWIFCEDIDHCLDWKTRKNIVLDIARGLAYLHEECRQKIAHLDVKPQNILLDDNFNAKLSDFGMSKLIKRDESEVVTHLRGTLGYLAPEWQHSRISVRADIYSFGIVLLEVVSGRRNLDYSLPDSDVHLLGLLQKVALENQLGEIIKCQSEDMQLHTEEAIEMIRLGMWCSREDCTRRPPISLVVKVLEGFVELESSISYGIPHVGSSASTSVLGSLASVKSSVAKL